MINRAADLLGEVLFRANKGSPLWLGVAEHLLQEEGRDANAGDLVASAELLAALWKTRLADAPGGSETQTAMHPTEVARLLPNDYPPSPGGEGRRGDNLDYTGVQRHAARQIAYGVLCQPVHPDVTRILKEQGIG
jgi:hypothetical protein